MNRLQNDGNIIPKDWVIASLGSICNIQGGFAFKSSDFGDEGVPVIRISNITDNGIDISKKPVHVKSPSTTVIEQFRLSRGDILVALSGATTGKYGIFQSDELVLVNQRVGRIRTENKPALSKYIFYYMGVLQAQILNKAYGAAQPNISTKEITEFQIPLPPLEQQKQIVAKIEELFSHIDAGVVALQKAKKLLKQYRQSVLKAAVTGELTREWREQNKDKLEPASELLKRILAERRSKWEEQQLEQFKAQGKVPKDDKWKETYKESEQIDCGLFSLPEKWQWVTLDTILLNIEAGKSFKCEERPPTDSETGIVKVSAVSWGEFNENESKTIQHEEKINSNYQIFKGDFLFSRANTIELVGACVIVNNIHKRLLLSDKILRFILLDGFKEWVRLCLRTQYGRDEIQNLATGNQDSMRNISQGNIKKIRIPILSGSELIEIISIVEYKLSLINRTTKNIDSQLIAAERNKQSILAAAFSGKLANING